MAVTAITLTQLYDTHRDRFTTTLNKMRSNKVLCDIQLQCGNNKLSAHKCVLAATSSYFNSLFSVDPSWSDPANEDPLNVPVDFHTMEMLLAYLYTGTLKVQAATLAPVIVASHLFRLTEVYQYCLSEVHNVIDMNNFTRLWKAGEKCSDKLLLAEVVAYTCENISWLNNQNAISRCSPSHLAAVYESGQLAVEEATTALCLWLQQDLNSRKHDVPRLTRKLQCVTTKEELQAVLEGKSYTHLPTITQLILQHFEDSPEVKIESVNKNNLHSNNNAAGNEGGCKPTPMARTTQNRTSAPKTPPLPPRKQSPANLTADINPKQTLPDVEAARNFQLSLKGGKHQRHTPELLGTTGTPSVVPEDLNAALNLCPPPSGDEQGEVPHLLVFAVTKNKGLAMQKYNLVTKCWSPSVEFPLPENYSVLPIISTLENHVYVVGGSTTDFSAAVYSTCIAKLAQTKRCSMLLPRVHFGVVSLNGLLYAIGGRNKTGWLRDVERYDPAQDVWHQVAPLSEAKSAPAVTVLHDRLYVVGGLSAAKNFSKSTECYNPISDQWSQLMPLSLGRYRMGIGATENKVFVLGGSKEREPTTCEDNFLVYEVDRNVWQSIPSPDIFMDDQPCIIAWDNKLWIISRRNFNLFSYLPENSSWSKLDTSSAVKNWKFIKSVLFMRPSNSDSDVKK